MDANWIEWIEAHPAFAGYVQMLGSILALAIAILIPFWQRQTLERAAALELRSKLKDVCLALSRVESLDEHDCLDEGPSELETVSPAEIARDLDRACMRLGLTSLQLLEPRCAVLVQELNDELSAICLHVSAHVEGKPNAPDVDINTLVGYEASVFALVREIQNVAPLARDGTLSHFINWRLDLHNSWHASTPKLAIKRIEPVSSVLKRMRARMSERF